jgi:phage-related protein
MPAIGPRCHELRVPDGRLTWRIIYRLDTDAVVIVEVFAKKTAQTAQGIIATCRTRLGEYDDA